MKPANKLRLSLLAGLVLVALSMSTVMAYKFGFARELGEPMFWRYYPPWAVVRWWRAWHDLYPQLFTSGLGLSAILLIAPAMALRAVEMYGPLKVNDRAPDLDLSTAAQLSGVPWIASKGDGVVLGKGKRGALRDDGDGHVLVMGPTRMGKGTGNVVPTLLAHSGSMLVFDPKHELSAITGRRRRQFGRVHVFDPTDRRSARFNPLLEVRLGDHLIGDCQMAAHTLAPGSAGASGEGKFWDDAARALLVALLVHVRQSADPTLRHLWHLTLALGAGRYPRTTHEFVAGKLAAHKKLEGRTRSGIDETLLTHLSVLADPLLQAMTATSDFRAGDLQADVEPVTIFVSIPVSDGQRLRPLTRMIMENLISPLSTDVTRTADGRMKLRPVLCLLDEFPQLGRLDVVERKMPICAGMGVRLALICQDEGQIRTLYGQHQSITINCGTIAVISGFSGVSLDTVQRWAGHHSVANVSKQIPNGIRGPHSHSQSESRVPLLDARDMIGRSSAEILVFTIGLPAPVWLPKVRYYRDSEFVGQFDALDAGDLPVPDLSPLPAGPALEFDEATPAQSNLPLAAGTATTDDLDMIEQVEDVICAMPEAARRELFRRAKRGEEA